MPLTALDELRARVQTLDSEVATADTAARAAQAAHEAALLHLAQVLDLRDQYDEVIAQAEADTRPRSTWLAPVVILDSRRQQDAA